MRGTCPRECVCISWKWPPRDARHTHTHTHTHTHVNGGKSFRVTGVYAPYCPYWRWINASKSKLTSQKSLWNYQNAISPLSGRGKYCLVIFRIRFFDGQLPRTIVRLGERKISLDDERHVEKRIFFKNVRTYVKAIENKRPTASRDESGGGLAVLLCGAARCFARGRLGKLFLQTVYAPLWGAANWKGNRVGFSSRRVPPFFSPLPDTCNTLSRCYTARVTRPCALSARVSHSLSLLRTNDVESLFK